MTSRMIHAGVRSRRNRLASVALVMVAAAGCADGAVWAPPRGHQGEALIEPIRLERARGAAAAAAQQGLDALARGDLPLANRAFSLALQSDPRSVALNHMNAVTYHLRVRAGDRGFAELAETGYLAALDQQRDFVAAGLQLGHLYYETGRFQAAQRVAAYVLDIETDNAEAARLLATSSYHAGDFELALWAVGHAKAVQPADRRVASIEPLVYAAVGLAERSRQAFEDPALPAADRSLLERRVRQWELHHGTLLAQAPLSPPQEVPARPDPAVPGALLPPPGPPPVPAPGATPAGPAGPPGVAIDFSAPAAPASTAAAAVSDQGMAPPGSGPVEPPWFDCQQSLNQQVGQSFFSGSTFGSSQTGDETIGLQPLPAPCRGRPLPRMAIIDVVMLRSDDVTSTGFGVNLLDNLNIFVSRTLNQSRGVNDTFSRTGSVADVLSLGTSSGGGITYSLNIANASDQSADIIARPSLLALDRQAAQFFSGSTVSVGLVSSQGGGTIQDKPVGVSLSVTPTFIDNETMLVSVKAARSFFESTASTATFTQSVQTSRNMVSANTRLRFNETLILSGLSEREITSTNSGVPLLRDLPGLQYFFQRSTGRDFTKSVIILMTPRRVASLADSVRMLEASYARDATEDPEVLRQARAKALAELGGVWPNQLLALRHMDRNMLFRGVRTGDLGQEEWEEPGRLRRLLLDAARLLVR